jgi:hypothetical protein
MGFHAFGAAERSVSIYARLPSQTARDKDKTGAIFVAPDFTRTKVNLLHVYLMLLTKNKS